MTKLLTTRWGVGINSVTGAARRGLCIGLLSALTLCTLAPQAQAACTKPVAAGIKGACLWVKAEVGTVPLPEGTKPLKTWRDQSNNNKSLHGDSTLVAGESKPGGGLNFNPVVRFNGTDQAMVNGQKDSGTDPSRISVFFVSRESPGAPRNGGSVFSYLYGTIPLVQASWPKSGGTLDWQLGAKNISKSAPFAQGVPNLGLVTNVKGGEAAIYVNAWKVKSDVGQTVTDDNVYGRSTRVGSGTATGDWYNGDIPELLEFGRDLTEDERTRVQSYLALKYGLTLVAAGVKGAYKNGKGDKVVYESPDEHYWNSIFGIGNDGVAAGTEGKTGLDQRVSRSTQKLDKVDKTALLPGDSPLIIATDDNFRSPNGDPRTQLGVGQYIVLGDDNGDLTKLTSATADSRGQRLQRVWRVQHTGDPAAANVYLGFDPEALKANFFAGKTGKLFISTDPTFSIGSAIDVYDLNIVTLPDNKGGGSFLTPVQSPGSTIMKSVTIPRGVRYLTLAQERFCEDKVADVPNACLWLKADDGMGAPQVDEWRDQSNNKKHLSKRLPDYNAPELIAGSATTGMNFNPVVRFDGKNQALMRNESALGSDGSEISLFFVNRTSSRTDAETFTHTDAADSPLTLSWDNSKSSKHRWFNGPSGRSIDVLSSTSIGVPHMGLVTDSKTGGGGIFVNAKRLDTLAAGAAANNLSVTRLGHGTENPGYHHGDIAELIEFKGQLSDAERTRVQSYLALKYGITLDRTELDGNAYKRSDGTSVYANAGYWHRIFGIGSDDVTKLYQRVAKSQEDGAVLTIATTDDLTSANNAASRTGPASPASPASRTQLGSGEYLVLGDNGKPLTLAPATKRLEREWFAQTTGGTFSVYLGFDAAALDTIFPTGERGYLQVSTDANPHALRRVGAFFRPVNSDGSFKPVSIPNGAVVSLVQACGGKALGIADACVWLKADTGVSAGSGWADQSGLHNDATATQTPTLVPNALNFNPVVSYSGGAGHTFSPDADVTTRYTFLGVARMENLTTNGPVFADALSQKLFGIEGGVQDRWSELPADSVGGHSGPVAASLFPRMHTLWRNDKDIKLRSNGAVIYNPSGLESGGAYRMTLASGGAWTRSADVSIPEFFSFNRPLGVSEINRIESYLALKYGLTLGTAVSYHSSGTATPGTIVWDGATGFSNRIFGLGRDSVTSLDQRVAKSQEPDAVLTITTANPDGSDTANFTSANSKSRTQLVADGQYLVLGDNGKPLTLDSTQRLQRVWRAQSTGGPIPVFLGLDATKVDLTNPAGKRMLWVEGGAGADGSFPTGRTTPYELSNTLVTGYWVPVANNTAKAVPILNGVSFLTYGVQSPPPPPPSPAQLPKLRLSVQSTGSVGTFGLSGDHNFGTDTATTAEQMVPIDLAEKTLSKDGEDVRITVTMLGTAAMPATNWSLESVSCTDAANPGSAVSTKRNGNQFTIDAAGVKMGSDLRCTLTTKYVAPPPPPSTNLPKLSLSVKNIASDTGKFEFSGTNGFQPIATTTIKSGESVDLATQTLRKDGEDVRITVTMLGTAAMPATNWSLEPVSCTDAANPGSAVSTKRNGNQFTIDAAGVKTGSDLRCALTTKYVAPIPPAQLPKLRLSVKNNASDTGKFEFSGTNGFQPIATTTIKSGESVDLATQTLSKDGEDVRITVTMLGTAAMPATNWSLESVSCTDAANPGSAVSTKRDGNQFTILATHVKAGSDLRCALVARYDSGSTLKTISGRVFVDNGAGGGVANDGKINGGEAGRSGVALRLTNCNGTTHAATSSSGDGSYRLLVPSSITGGDMCVAQTLSDDYRVTQGGVEASGVTLDTTAAQRNRWRFNYTGASVQNLNIGNVPSSRLLLDGWGRGMVGDTVDFPHRFIAGTDGRLTFAVTDASSTTSGWGETLYRDVNCDAKFDAGAAPLGDSLTVKADENVCVIVRQFVPAGPYEGATRQFQLQATLKWDKVDVSEPLTNRDHTTVGAQPLRLYKQVRNVNTGEPWTTRNSAKPGEILEYCITFTNQAPEKIDDLVISGATPNYTTLVSAECPTNQPTTTVTTGCPDVLPAGMGCTVTKPVVGGTGSLRWQFTGPLRPRAEGAVTYQVKVNDK